jgi:hypothetical protein
MADARMKDKPEHPAIISGCTKAQIEAFERIAVNMPANAQQRTLDALSALGLIKYSERQGRDAFGSFVIRTPYVPVPIHMAWCEWCDENVADDTGRVE